ncbi:MAG: cytidylate kinase [Epulopiscium sp. Nele67-Bin004]|nr:MAG: cytidylate kinase [Epulopiscium sp. Nele67-Bin004]
MFSVAIDGPAGAGKSTIAKEVAKQLNWVYIDTGAMYRTVAVYCLENDVDVQNNQQVTNIINKINIDITHIDGEQHILLNSVDVTSAIRTQEISNLASFVATHQCVREILVIMQQKLAKHLNVVMDGRDIGTVVLPKANLKIFLTASSEERARRRFKEQSIQSFEEILIDINKRDEVDYNRKISPLKKADDAIVLDTSNLDIEEVISIIIKMINKGVQSGDYCS